MGYQHPNSEDLKFIGSWGFWLLALVCIAFVILVPVGFLMNWFSVPFRVASPQNVERQFDHLYTNHNSLKATANNVCSAEKLITDATTDPERSQRSSQAEVQRQNYRRIAADYDQAAGNAFKAGVVGKPADLPVKAPSLEEMRREVCPR